MKGNTILKRVIAYLIDILLVTFVSSSLAYISFINPKYDEYIEVSDKYNEILTDYYDKEITIEEFSDQSKELSYNLNKTGYVYIIGDILIAFLYFGVFAYFTNGQTLGKKIMKLKVVSNKKDKKLKIYNYFIRVFILNGVISSIITLISICFSKNTYYSIYTASSNFNTILELIILLMILFNKEGRGLHDVLAGTKVIDLKDTANEPEIKLEPKEEIEIIKPKKNSKNKSEDDN